MNSQGKTRKSYSFKVKPEYAVLLHHLASFLDHVVTQCDGSLEGIDVKMKAEGISDRKVEITIDLLDARLKGASNETSYPQ